MKTAVVAKKKVAKPILCENANEIESKVRGERKTENTAVNMNNDEDRQP